jgi:hypothetical protein
MVRRTKCCAVPSDTFAKLFSSLPCYCTWCALAPVLFHIALGGLCALQNLLKVRCLNTTVFTEDPVIAQTAFPLADAVYGAAIPLQIAVMKTNGKSVCLPGGHRRCANTVPSANPCACIVCVVLSRVVRVVSHSGEQGLL